MIDRRDQCMAEIAWFESERGDWGSLIDKARQLLTRHWSVSSWRARADILRTAEWLIGVGKQGADPASISPVGARLISPLAMTGHDRNRAHLCIGGSFQ